MVGIGNMGWFGYDLLNLSPADPLITSIKSTAQWENQITCMELFNHFSNIGITRLEWHGLPASVSERFLNMTLYLYGSAAFFYDEVMGYLALPCATNGAFNVYYDPTSVRAYSFNYEKLLQPWEFVYMRNNPTASPTALSVWEFVKRMADVLRTIDVVCKKLKQPFIIICDEKERLTYRNMLKKIMDNEVAVLGTKNYDLGKSTVNVVPTTVNADLAKLWETYYSLESILYARLGIESVGQEKKERLIVDEVNANNMVTDMSIETNLKELNLACEEINRKFDLNVSVTAKTIDDYRQETVQDGGEEDG